MNGARALAFVLLILSAACGDGGARDSERAMSAAVDRLRDEKGDTSQRRIRIAALAQLKARTPLESEAQGACARAYTDLCDAEDGIFLAEARMKQATAFGAAPESVVADVARADDLLQRARRALPECDAAAARLAAAAR